MTRVEKAIVNHKKGYNCAQCVACAFHEEIGIDEDIIFRMAEGFGAGMGGMKATCGALSGAALIFGLKNSTGTQKIGSKSGTCKMSKALIQQFEEKNGAVICGDLKGIQTKKPLRSCDGCIQDAIEIAEKILKESE